MAACHRRAGHRASFPRRLSPPPRGRLEGCRADHQGAVQRVKRSGVAGWMRQRRPLGVLRTSTRKGLSPLIPSDLVLASRTSSARRVRSRSMGASRDDFLKYPRAPHLFGSRGTSDDKHLGPRESRAILADASLIVEEKLDGTNVGIHFGRDGRMVLQCRGHEITAGMHPQYDLFKQWATAKTTMLEAMLADRFVLYGEWLYARHSVHYRALPHYFFEFDIYDKREQRFLDLAARLRMLEGTGIHTVPVVHRGIANEDQMRRLIAPSAFE